MPYWVTTKESGGEGLRLQNQKEVNRFALNALKENPEAVIRVHNPKKGDKVIRSLKDLYYNAASPRALGLSKDDLEVCLPKPPVVELMRELQITKGSKYWYIGDRIVAFEELVNIVREHHRKKTNKMCTAVYTIRYWLKQWEIHGDKREKKPEGYIFPATSCGTDEGADANEASPELC